MLKDGRALVDSVLQRNPDPALFDKILKALIWLLDTVLLQRSRKPAGQELTPRLQGERLEAHIVGLTKKPWHEIKEYIIHHDSTYRQKSQEEKDMDSVSCTMYPNPRGLAHSSNP